MTAPNKNEGLIARLERHWHSNKHWGLINPDGPEAARAIQDLEEEVGRLREALKPFADCADFWEPIYDDSEPMMKPAAFVDRWRRINGRKSTIPQFTVGNLRSARKALASTADGGALRPSSSVPAGAVIQGEDNRQERRE